MKIAICIAAVAALVGTCYRSNTGGTLAANDNVIEYQIQGNRYAVVIIREKGMSESQARKLARQRAAEITVENGNRYFTIETESDIQMVKSSKNLDDNSAFYGNMYQELIVEGDFSKQQLQGQNTPTSSVVPGLRTVFIMYPTKTSTTSIDACKYTNCK